MDKSKFVERPGDSEGFEDSTVLPSTFDGEKGTYSDPKCGTCPNPKGWDEVDGVKLPSVSPWAQLDGADLDKVHAIWRGK